MDNLTRARIDRTTRLLLLLMLVISLSGCSALEQANSQSAGSAADPAPQAGATPSAKSNANSLVPDRFVAERIMVNDLLSAIVQILPPITSTVQISASNDNELTLLVAEIMALSGFGIQKVTTDQGAWLISTDMHVEKKSNNGAPVKNLRINVGEISIDRAYVFTTNQTVQPSSPFTVYGSRSRIDHTKTLFSTNSAMAITEYLAPIKLEEPLPLLSLITPDIVKSSAIENPNSPELTSINSAKVEVNNLHFGESTFGPVLNNHLPIDDLTVVFPNDSITLGNENKILIRQFMGRFNERLDLVSVVGCSNGPTAAAIGNVGLAFGRGERVTEELISLGIPREKILDQGCWAPSGGGKYPGRGVVLELWRQEV